MRSLNSMVLERGLTPPYVCAQGVATNERRKELEEPAMADTIKQGHSFPHLRCEESLGA